MNILDVEIENIPEETSMLGSLKKIHTFGNEIHHSTLDQK